MKNTGPQILVTHPGKQHSHRLVLALQQCEFLQKYVTSVWYSKNIYPYKLFMNLPFFEDSYIERELKKRGHESIRNENVLQFPYFELIREFLDRVLRGYKSDLGIYYINQIHDYYVSKMLGNINPDIVIGSETACLRTFREAKKLKIRTILDLPSVHFSQIENVSDKYPEYKNSFKNTGLINRQNDLKKKELELSDYIITISEYSKQSLVSSGISQDKIYVINLGFDPSLFRPKKKYRGRGKFKIIYVGQISIRKGLKVLIQAFNNLNLENSELILIGGMAGSKDLINHFDNKIKHIPYCTHEQLVSYYQDADIFVLPSYTDSWGMVVIEAMACGLPVIVSQNTGSKEAIVEGKSGFIIDVEDEKSLEEKILFFYDDRSRCETFGMESSRLAQEYTWSNYNKAVRDMVLDVNKQFIN